MSSSTKPSSLSDAVRVLADLIFDMGEKLPDADYKKALDLCAIINHSSIDTHHGVEADVQRARELVLCASETVLDLRQEIEQLKVNQIETENHFGIISDAWVAEQAKVAELDAKLNKALAENLPHSY